ncbi:hypothetical protein [Methylomonas fluvii]|uniref:Uncharacterized protein n=1 Tax=Methylomonas fluvii TaxID=1854564 RepID=A0ABR9DH93_9GAMM|nr:hypothetical protein [Methylomonas fluvii]MBD9362447.1 hypothetical protein [Methylomonas fluvii]
MNEQQVKPEPAKPPEEKKAWCTPELREQTVLSATAAKSNSPNESSPNSGPPS